MKTMSLILITFLSLNYFSENAFSFETTRRELMQHFRTQTKAGEQTLKKMKGDWYETQHSDGIYPNDCGALGEFQLDLKEDISLKRPSFDEDGHIKITQERSSMKITVQNIGATVPPTNPGESAELIGGVLKYQHFGGFNGDVQQFVFCTLLDQAITNKEALVCFKTVRDGGDLSTSCGHFDFFVRK